LHFIAERACKASTDQKIELLIVEKFAEPLTANLFPDAGMKHFNRTIIYVAANYPDTISISARFIPESPQKFGAFRRQSKRDRNHEIAARFLQKATKETKAVIDLESLGIRVPQRNS